MSNRQSDPQKCRRASEVLPYLQGELDEKSRADFAAHLAACPICAREAESFSSVLQELKAVPSATATRDLAPGILERIGQPGSPWAPLWLIRAAAVLLVTFLAGAAWLWLTRPEAQQQAAAQAESNAAIQASLDWLHEAQQEDGQLDATRWGAQPMYAPGVTALALLALLRSDDHPFDGVYGPAIERGLNYLVRIQKAGGQFGTLTSGTPYNHALSTLALLEGCRHWPKDEWRSAAERGVEYVRSTQRQVGGWGYPREAADKANTSITVWQLQVLLEAQANKLVVEPELGRGLAWLEGVVDEAGHVGYSRSGDFPNGRDTLTAAGALCMMMADDRGAESADTSVAQVLAALMRTAEQPAEGRDHYRDYFLTRALAMAGTERARPLLAELRQSLETAGAGSGTPDRWSSAGGRVYETAMFALALQSTR